MANFIVSTKLAVGCTSVQLSVQDLDIPNLTSTEIYVSGTYKYPFYTFIAGTALFGVKDSTSIKRLVFDSAYSAPFEVSSSTWYNDTY